MGCRATADKSQLARIVRTPDGRIEIDPTGRAPGRGGYVHRDESCIARAARGGTIGRTLRASLDPSQAARLVSELRESLGDAG